MGHVWGPADDEYVKKNPIMYLDNLAEGEKFRMSQVQFYYEGPYDFTTVFTRREAVSGGFRCEFGVRESLTLPGEINVNRVTEGD